MNKRNNPKTRSKNKELKELPPREVLLEVGINPDDFEKHYRVVVCPLCLQSGRSQFLFLVYVGFDTKGARIAHAFLAIRSPGQNSKGEARVSWYGGSEFSRSCDEGHTTTLTAKGEIACRARHSDEGTR